MPQTCFSIGARLAPYAHRRSTVACFAPRPDPNLRSSLLLMGDVAEGGPGRRRALLADNGIPLTSGPCGWVASNSRGPLASCPDFTPTASPGRIGLRSRRRSALHVAFHAVVEDQLACEQMRNKPSWAEFADIAGEICRCLRYGNRIARSSLQAQVADRSLVLPHTRDRARSPSCISMASLAWTGRGANAPISMPRACRPYVRQMRCCATGRHHRWVRRGPWSFELRIERFVRR